MITTIIRKMFTLLTNLAAFFQSSVDVVAPHSPLVTSLPVPVLNSPGVLSPPSLALLVGPLGGGQAVREGGFSPPPWGKRQGQGVRGPRGVRP